MKILGLALITSVNFCMPQTHENPPGGPALTHATDNQDNQGSAKEMLRMAHELRQLRAQQNSKLPSPELQQAQKERDEAKSAETALQQRIKKVETDLATAHTTIAKLSKDTREHKNEALELQKKLSKAQEEFNNLKKASQEQIDSAVARAMASGQDYQAEHTKNRALNESVKRLEQRVNNLSTDVITLTQQKSVLQKNSQEWQQKAGSLQQDSISLRKDLVNSERALNLKIEEISMLKSIPRIQMIHQDTHVEIDLRARNKALDKALNDERTLHDDTRSGLRKERDKLLSSEKNFFTLNNKHKELQTQYDQLRKTDAALLQQKLDAEQQRTATSKKNIEALQAQLAWRMHSAWCIPVLAMGVIVGKIK